MRGQQERSGSLFSYVSIEERIPSSHPLRRIRKLADQALDRLNPTFCRLYALEGRPSVPLEQLLLASLLQAFYGIRSERLLLEQLHYNLQFRWFVGLSPGDVIWHPTTFTKNRGRKDHPQHGSSYQLNGWGLKVNMFTRWNVSRSGAAFASSMKRGCSDRSTNAINLANAWLWAGMWMSLPRKRRIASLLAIGDGVGSISSRTQPGLSLPPPPTTPPLLRQQNAEIDCCGTDLEIHLLTAPDSLQQINA